MGKPESWAARRSGSGRRGGGDVPGHPVGAGSQPAAGRAAAHSALGLGAAAGSTRRGCHSPSGNTGGSVRQHYLYVGRWRCDKLSLAIVVVGSD